MGTKNITPKKIILRIIESVESYILSIPTTEDNYCRINQTKKDLSSLKANLNSMNLNEMVGAVEEIEKNDLLKKDLQLFNFVKDNLMQAEKSNQ